MILILEDDADREAYQHGHVRLNADYVPKEDLRPVTVWISTEAYEEKVRADERERLTATEDVWARLVAKDALTVLRAKVQPLYDEAYRTSAWNDVDVGQLTAYRKVLALIDLIRFGSE